MSISRPYNKFTVRDLYKVEQPYVNSAAEFGYFSGTNLGTIPQNKWYSLTSVLNTNNGIANVAAANGGLNILNAGIYKIKLSVFPTATQDGSSNISFNFGTTYLSNIPTSSSASAFGGPRPDGMFTYDPSNNPYTPGILTWVADGYNSANSTINNFIKNSTTNELSYNYFNAGYLNNALYSGNCTTEMTFVVDSQETIFFNVSTNSTTGVTMGNCFFTLELICNNTALIPSLYWHKSGAPLANWSSIALDSGGSKLAASGTRIWTSNNYGVNWTLQIINNLTWSGIAVAGGGFPYMAACVNGGYIYSSSDSGVNWFQRTFEPLNWTTIATSSQGIGYIACAPGVGIWVSTNSCVTWTQINSDASKKWSSIITDGNGITICYACENPGSVWKTTNGGSTWTDQSANGIPSTSQNWTSISAAYGAAKVAACIDGGGIWYTTNSGSTWTPSNAQELSWSGISCPAQTTFNNFYACVKGGRIWRSQNSGAIWTDLSANNSGLPNGLPTSANWSSIATSNDGAIAAACVNGGRIWRSGDSGANWIAVTSDASRNWVNLTSNYSYFAAVVSDGPYVYPALNNTLNWIQRNTEFNRSWTSIASDSTRTKLAACASGSNVITENTGGIWTSIDSGINWTPRTSGLPSSTLATGGPNWTSIASDSTGTNLAACVSPGFIYTSSNSGGIWTDRTNASSRSWTCIASDSNGTNLAACASGSTGGIWTSADSGVTWEQRTSILPTNVNWTSITSNSTGQYLAACVNPGFIYTSADSGLNWTQRTNAGSRNWTSIASNSTGTNLAAVVNGGTIWVSTDSGTNWSRQSGAIPNNGLWKSIASDSTGTNLAAVTNDDGGNIYTRLYS